MVSCSRSLTISSLDNCAATGSFGNSLNYSDYVNVCITWKDGRTGIDRGKELEEKLKFYILWRGN